MSEPKPLASLTPTLLARKGGARPAMRPQLGPLHAFHDAAALEAEDLGWNDMGEDPVDENPVNAAPVEAPVRHEAEIVQLSNAVPAEAHVPEVLRQRESAAAIVARPRRSALAEGRRAAFTLRMDRDRHLQLRLACTVSNRSAQQIVTEALDRLLADMPEIAVLADRVRQRG